MIPLDDTKHPSNSAFNNRLETNCDSFSLNCDSLNRNQGHSFTWFFDHSLYGSFYCFFVSGQNKNKPAFLAAYFYLLFFNYLRTAAPTKPTITPTANATDIVCPPFILYFFLLLIRYNIK